MAGVRINNTIFSWTSCIFLFDLIAYKKIQALDFEDKREGEIVYGAQLDGTPLGQTEGKYMPSPLTVTMLKDEFYQKLAPQLAAKGVGSLGDAESNFLAQYIEPVPGAIPMVVAATGLKLRGIKDSHQEGTGALTVELTFQPLLITRNGLPLWSLVRSALDIAA